MTVTLRIQRWRCRNKGCKRQILAAQLPEIAAPLARRTARVKARHQRMKQSSALSGEVKEVSKSH